MSDNTHIEWTDATSKVCGQCKTAKTLDQFGTDRSRVDGHSYICKTCKNDRARLRYSAKERPKPGRRFVPPRDGDYRQARRRVNHLIDVGVLPPPNTLPCTDCGHLWTQGGRRHEYDHHLGYAACHHETVEPVCTTCHHAREEARRAA